MEYLESSYTTRTLEKVELFATELISQFNEKVVYHDINFANRIIEISKKIGLHSSLDDKEMEMLLIVAWFHATGYGRQKIELKDRFISSNLHEISSENARNFFDENQLDSEFQTRILFELELMRDNNEDSSPIKDILSDVLLADIIRNGKSKKHLKLSHKELLLQDIRLSKKEYYDILSNTFKLYSIKSEYGKQKVQANLNVFLQKLQKGKKNIEKKVDIILGQELGISDSELKSLKKSLNSIKGRDDRGIQTLFRTTSKNHYTLNEMVDKKASIMITVNSIILSLIISGLTTGGAPPEELLDMLPVLVLSFTCISSIVLAVMSIRPTNEHGKFTEAEIRNKSGNLLFFGNFSKMQIKDYEWGMLQMLNDSDYLYGTMIRDLYFLGVKLQRKYRLIRLTLNIFIVGMSLAFLIFIFHSLFHDHHFINL